MMTTMIATCHCNKVSVLFNTPVSTVVQCHCENCRRLQGSDYSTWIAVPNAQVQQVKGEQYITQYAFNQRSSKSFCKCCGTCINGINGKHFEQHIVIPLGIVVEYETALAPQVQVYSQEKAPWVALAEQVKIHS
jgi:hypothetical protein